MFGSKRVFYQLLLLSSCLSLVKSIQLQSCDQNPLVRVNLLEIHPEELRQGGEATLDVAWNAFRGNIVPPVKVVTKLAKRMGPVKVMMPCLEGYIGSCTHNNICNLLPEPFCHQMSKGMHEVRGMKFKVPNLHNPNAPGNYDFEVKAFDGTGKSLGCWQGSMKIAK